MITKDDYKTEFKLGLTMAGAVTAGAYSAGCLYYLLRNLELWERKKISKECNSIPRHKVTLEVLGGASAGSMVTAIAALTFGLKKDINNIEELDTTDLQYDAWVNLLDKEEHVKKGTLMELLKPNKKDSENAGKFSLFNSDFLDQLRDRIIDKIILSEKREWPVYISEHLQILFTLTSLNGVPVGVSFSKDKPDSPESPVHYMKLHQVTSHHKREPEGKDTSPLIKLPRVNNLEISEHISDEQKAIIKRKKKEMQEFVDYALASGAFPIGFPPVDLNLSGSLLKHHLQNYFFKDYDKKLILGKVAEASQFDFTAIDGGTLNNEPFVEVKNILNDLIQDLGKDNARSVNNYKSLIQSLEKHTYKTGQNQSAKNFVEDLNREFIKGEIQVFDAIMMIDPFPNFTDIDIDTLNSNTPKEIVMNIIGALRGQAMVKNPDRILDFINGERFGMIFPSRRVNGERVKDEPHLATSSVGAFGGFLSEEFRKHDFMLGMKNCQSFIRRYFCINETAKDKYLCFANWNINDERYKRFAYKEKGDNNSQLIRFPIIPDMALEHHNDEPDEKARFNKTAIQVMEYPKIEPKHVTRYARPLRKRLFYLGKKWLFSPSKKSSADPDSTPSFVKPFETANWLRNAAIAVFLLALLGYLYWLLPTATFWLMLVVVAVVIILAAYFLFRNAISSLFANLLRQLSNRNQLKT